jgi:hypothetical protein
LLERSAHGFVQDSSMFVLVGIRIVDTTAGKRGQEKLIGSADVYNLRQEAPDRPGFDAPTKG